MDHRTLQSHPTDIGSRQVHHLVFVCNGDDDVDGSDVDYAGRRHVHDLTRL